MRNYRCICVYRRGDASPAAVCIDIGIGRIDWYHQEMIDDPALTLDLEVESRIDKIADQRFNLMTRLWNDLYGR